MSEFTVLYDGGADFYQSFFWTRESQGRRDFFCKLIAIDIQQKGIVPLYLPLLSTSWRNGQLTIWINISRWQSFVILADKRGIQTKYSDVRKEFDQDE